MKYSAGQKVRIKSIDWYNRHTNGTEVHCGAYPFTSDMKEFCGQERIIANVCQECYVLLGIDDRFVWTDEMIEGLVEEEETKPLTYEETVEIIETMQGIGDSWECPQGYQFVDENGNVINAMKIVLKKRKEYPKTYGECAEIMNCPIAGPSGWLFNFDANIKDPYYRKIDILMGKFTRLLICRDAYWKIAGEEMRLGNPWEPNWGKGACYTICCNANQIVIGTDKFRNAVLAFPTEEMRDAFYENFKSEIEICKELL